MNSSADWWWEEQGLAQWGQTSVLLSLERESGMVSVLLWEPVSGALWELLLEVRPSGPVSGPLWELVLEVRPSGPASDLVLCSGLSSLHCKGTSIWSSPPNRRRTHST